VVRDRGGSEFSPAGREPFFSVPISLDIWVNKFGEDHGHRMVPVSIPLHTIQ
jgi:hypothetical protein